MKLTTGSDFQGYFITEYLDVIFDEMLVGLGFGTAFKSNFDNFFSSLSGSEATEMIGKLNSVKAQLRDRVITKAKKLGANALIGIDFESSKLGELIMVSMAATAVKIDKIISPLPLTQTEQKKQEELIQKAAQAEKRQQILENIQSHLNDFNKELFLDTLNEFKTTKEMVEYIEKAASDSPDVFDDNMVQSLGEFVQIERMYGKGMGRQKVITTIKEYFNL